MVSKKATEFDKIFAVDVTLCIKCQIDSEDFVNFCGLLGKCELYDTISFQKTCLMPCPSKVRSF